jgi:superfamily II DNA/RNA helicase
MHYFPDVFSLSLSLTFSPPHFYPTIQPYLSAINIKDPTQVQIASIPDIVAGKNVAIQSHTGSGKTLAYLLPVLTLAIQKAEEEWANVTRKTAASTGTVQAVIVVPSRELAMQIVRVAQSLLPADARKAVQQCIGGANFLRQKEALKLNKPFLVVGTPGRLAEMSRDGSLQSHGSGILVLDEVDQLLAPQFREEMSRITDHTGKKAVNGRQTIVVSATLTPKVLQHLQGWCPNAQHVYVSGAKNIAASAAGSFSERWQGDDDANNDGDASSSNDSSSNLESFASSGTVAPSWGWGNSQKSNPLAERTSSSAGFAADAHAAAAAMPPHITHCYISCAPQHKVDTIRKTMHALGIEKALIFMNFQQRLKDTEAKLAAKNMSVGSLHGELTKQQRSSTLAAFRAGKYRALVVSDVAARGLDVFDCDAVIHMELPSDAAHYAHRAGRTGRAGRPGVVVSVVSGGEKFVVDKLAGKLKINIPEVDLSHGEMVMASEEGREERKKSLVMRAKSDNNNNNNSASSNNIQGRER